MSDSRPSSFRPIFGLIAALLVLAVFFLIGELFFRSVHAADVQSLQEKYEADRDLFFKKADKPGRIYGYNPENEATNKQGYLGHDWEVEKAEGVYRIVVIGDSVAAGQGASWGKQYAWQLEKKLNAASSALGDRKFEVLLLAVTGYSTVQELAVLEQDAYRYSPDLVLWAYVLNDPAHPVYHDASGELARYFFKPKSHMVHEISKAIFTAREKVVIKRKVPEGLHPDHWNWHKKLAAAHEKQIQRELLKIRKISQAKAPDVPVLFAIHPAFHAHHDFDKYAFKKLTNELRKFTRDKAKLIPLDLRYAYEGLSQDEVRIHPPEGENFDPWHINDLGHELVAEFLFDFISEGLTQGWESVRKGIPAPPQPAVSVSEPQSSPTP